MGNSEKFINPEYSIQILFSNPLQHAYHLRLYSHEIKSWHIHLTTDAF